MPGTYDTNEAALPPSLDPSFDLSLDPSFDLSLDPDLGAVDHDDPRDMFDDEALDDDADDREHQVAHRPNPLPSREEDEEELAEADMHEGLEVDPAERALRDR